MRCPLKIYLNVDLIAISDNGNGFIANMRNKYRVAMAKMARPFKYLAVAVVIVLIAGGILYAIYRSQESTLRLVGTYEFAPDEIMEKDFNVTGYFASFNVKGVSSIRATSAFQLVVISQKYADQLVRQLEGNLSGGSTVIVSQDHSIIKAWITFTPGNTLSTDAIVYKGSISSGEYAVLLINSADMNNSVSMDVTIEY